MSVLMTIPYRWAIPVCLFFSWVYMRTKYHWTQLLVSIHKVKLGSKLKHLLGCLHLRFGPCAPRWLGQAHLEGMGCVGQREG